MIVALAGGVGLFLLGMMLLTDGLKAVAGDALRAILTRWVRGPISGACWGAVLTALVQSSTATTLATVGFVSAGLLTFTQSVGVILGANIGTTSTGWIVSQLGFKVSLGQIAPPIVLLGVVLRLLRRGRWSHAGTALAGFGLLFIGIDMIQGGMAGLAARIDPGDLPGADGDDGLRARAVLVGIGAIMTVVMQSSSASMAVTLAAVASGSVLPVQAAALVVGHNIGSVATAAFAAIGSPVPARRTVMVHVLFNVFAGAVAFAFMPWMWRACQAIAGVMGATDAPTALAAFHTAQNVVGVALVLPGVGVFSTLIERLIPDRSPRPTRFLGPAVAEVGPVALEAARRALGGVLGAVAGVAGRAVREGPAGARADLPAMAAAIADIRRFVHSLGRAAQGGAEVDRQAGLLHACDHAARLIDALDDPPEPGGLARDDAAVASAADLLADLASDLARACTADGAEPPGVRIPLSAAPVVARAEAVSRELAAARKRERRAALDAVAAGRLDPDRASARIEAMLWLDRVAYHLWRAARYIAQDGAVRPATPGAPPADVPPAPDDAGPTPEHGGPPRGRASPAGGAGATPRSPGPAS